jgi:hypothetical protein
LQITKKTGTFRVSARITNTGRRAAAEVVQLYIGAPERAHEPPKQLKGYDKVALRPGHTRSVRFTLRARDLAAWRSRGGWTVVPGRYRRDDRQFFPGPARLTEQFNVRSRVTGRLRAFSTRSWLCPRGPRRNSSTRFEAVRISV